MERAHRDATRNLTFLSHWGLHRDHSVAGWKANHIPGKVRMAVLAELRSLGGRRRKGGHSGLRQSHILLALLLVADTTRLEP
jgi:hypothetical protein